MDWIQEILPYRNVRILQVGAESIDLVKGLHSTGYHHLAVVEPRGEILTRSRATLGVVRAQVEWIEADVLEYRAIRPFALWVDPEFLVRLEESSALCNYGHAVWNSLLPGGFALAALACPHCPAPGGLDPEALVREWGPAFRLRSVRNIGDSLFGLIERL